MPPMRTPKVLLLALAVVAGALAWPGTAGAAYSDPLTTTTKQNLVWHATPAAALTALDNALPNVSLNTVVNDTSYAMTGCTSAEKAALPKAPAATKSLCWDSERAGSTTWVPQGITTSGDADDDGMWGADKVILSGWHGTDALGRYNDARIQAVNYNDPAAAAHRMMYLAVPNSTGSSFSAAKAHMGGMAWLGDKIYVTAVGNTSTAIRVFSTKHILQLTDTTSDAIGKTSAGYAAYTYKYAMMQVGYYTYAGGTCSMASDTGVPCFSSISLDRSTSPASIVTTEYFSDQSLHGRLYRFPMGTDYLLTGTAAEAFRSSVGNMQGVLSHDGKWYVAHSSATINGQLWAQTTAASTAATCGSTSACWAVHPEALTYDWSTGLVWSQSEWSTADCQAQSQTCGRSVFAVPLSSLG
ncbi:Secreted protein [Amycolatopsis camponoti]|uniref:Secreted protein n=2 Tax=Amycolatopsis camponoti TaxID=2606593 RepID=A0A6I8M1J7_9PSEU|nr:Secreted protein [Amycolatopsis camponoti]